MSRGASKEIALYESNIVPDRVRFAFTGRPKRANKEWQARFTHPVDGSKDVVLRLSLHSGSGNQSASASLWIVPQGQHVATDVTPYERMNHSITGNKFEYSKTSRDKPSASVYTDLTGQEKTVQQFLQFMAFAVPNFVLEEPASSHEPRHWEALKEILHEAYVRKVDERA